jgi:hypothetical protein
MMSKSIVGGLVWGGTILLCSFLLRLAQGNQLISADTASRGALVVIGLTLAVFANFMTKQNRAAPTERGGRLQGAVRISAWLFCLGALIYAAASAFAPHPLDEILSMGAVGIAIVVSVGLFIRACARTA